MPSANAPTLDKDRDLGPKFQLENRKSTHAVNSTQTLPAETGDTEITRFNARW